MVKAKKEVVKETTKKKATKKTVVKKVVVAKPIKEKKAKVAKKPSVSKKDVRPIESGFINQVTNQIWVNGGESGSILSGNEVILHVSERMDHSAILPEDEKQHAPGFDSFSCVTFSALSVIESKFNHLISMGKVSPDNISWLKENGYFSNGKINFSDSFTAVASKTTVKGNTIEGVGNGIKEYGLIPETMRPFTDTWDEFHRPLTDSEIAIGQEFKKRFLIEYEWKAVRKQSGDGTTTDPDAIRVALAYGPFQTAGLVCSGWGWDNIVKGCGLGGQHAFVVYGITEDNHYLVYDSYKTFRKVMAPDYQFLCGVQYWVGEKAPIQELRKEVSSIVGYNFNHKDFPNLTFGKKSNPSWAVHNIQMALQHLGYMKKGVYGPFGPQTKLALWRFQQASKIKDDGTNFGPKTKKALTKAVAAPSKPLGARVKAKLGQAITSSESPDNISLTIKGLLVVLAPVIIHYTGWSETELGSIIEALTTFISASMVFGGLLRKALNKRWSAKK